VVVYLDTSSLVKLYVEEEDSPQIYDMLSDAGAAATSLIAYAEARAAFARRYREKAFTARQYKMLISSFHEDWGRLLVLKVTEDLMRSSGELAERHGLRGFDAIHLSSALTLKKETAAPVFFSCADRKLQRASLKENLTQPLFLRHKPN
jgi:predicted nucleic acid-binding protein